MKRTKITVGLLLCSCLFLPFFSSSCAMPTISRFEEEDVSIQEVFKSASTVSVVWIYDESTAIESYNLYYRAHGSSRWLLIDTISSIAPMFTVDHNVMGDGKWEFGVSAVDSLGTESEIHSSLDDTAEPSSGWYLLWIK